MDLTLLQHTIHLNNTQYYALIFVGSVLAIKGLSFVLLKLMRIYVAKAFPAISRQIDVRKQFSPWLSIFIGIIVLFKLSQSILPGTRFEFLISAFRISIIYAGVILGVRAIPLLKGMGQEYFGHGNTNDFKIREISTQFQFIEKIAQITLWAAAFVATLCSFHEGRDFAKSLVASAGILGVLLGFAAQRSLGNLMAGFQIAFTQPIRLDDVVIVENQWGRVEKITLTYVVVCLWDLRRLVVPIHHFIEKPFENWTKTSRDLLPFFYLYVDYSFPVDALRKEYERIIKESPLWDKKLCLMQVTDFTEKTMQIRALMSAKNASEAFDLRCYVREKLVAFIQKNYPDSFPKNRLESGQLLNSEKTDGFLKASELKDLAQHLLVREPTNIRGEKNEYAKTGN